MNRIPNASLAPLFLLISLMAIVAAPFVGAVAFAASVPEPVSRDEGKASDSGSLSSSHTCTLSPLAEPPTPSKVPGYAELDPSTGLHVTGTAQPIDRETYRLEVTGKVDHPLALGYDELRCMPRTSGRPVLICPGFFSDTASWTGVPLKYVIDLAGAKPDAKEVSLTGADNYTATLSMDVATASGNFLAYEWEGKALPKLHGFPLRAVLPGLEGNRWVKWLLKIEIR